MTAVTTASIDRIPAAYAGFSALFAQMDAPLMAVIGGVLRALSDRPELLGTFENQPDGEFVGYDGLENRGKLANLLETEWLLRELDADDFVRRVAEGEVLFRRRDFKGTGKNNTLAVILDCGPWMLGRNRLVALAALFYLVLRAERSGAALHWIVPGATDAGWLSELTRDSIGAFLGRVVQGPLTSDIIESALGGLDIQGDLDCWYVGSRQTATAADHPEVSSSFLLHQSYGNDGAELEVIARRRRLMKVDVRLPDDKTAIAALRRPFKPEVHKKIRRPAHADGDSPVSALPFRTGWILDRHNQAVLIRLKQGVLWQPLRAPMREQSIWLPLRDGTQLLGVQAHRSGEISALTARPIENDTITGADICQLNLFRANRINGSWTCRKTGDGHATLDLKQFRALAMGNMHHDRTVSLVAGDGSRFTLNVTESGDIQAPKIGKARVIFSDGAYRVELVGDTDPQMRVTSISRGTIMMTEPAIHDPKELLAEPRQVLFAPSSKTLSVSLDGQDHTIFARDEPKSVSIPDGLTLISLENPIKGLAWDSEKSELVQLHFWGKHTHHKVIASFSGRRFLLPRYCPLTGTVFAIEPEGPDGSETFTPIHIRRGWGSAERIDVMAAIERAPTKWLDT